MARPKGGGGDAREKLIGGIGRGFRAGGFGGIGVDALAKEAGLTSGAFYAHFGSKNEAFMVAVSEGLKFLHSAIESFQSEHGSKWRSPFVDYYLGPRMELDMPDACALPSFSADVARGSAETRAAYTRELKSIAELIANRLGGKDREARSWQLLSILSGAAGTARAVDEPKLRAAILEAAKALAKAV